MAEWQHDPNAINCDECRKFHEVKNKKLDCDNCDRMISKPELLMENYPVISLVERYNALLVNGMGGISAEGINMALDCELWISDTDKSSYIRKLITYLTAAIKTQQKDTTLNGAQNPDRSTSRR